MFVDKAVGICKIAKMARVTIYTGFRPTDGSSCRGAKIYGANDSLGSGNSGKSVN